MATLLDRFGGYVPSLNPAFGPSAPAPGNSLSFGQVMFYTVSPSADGLVPADPTGPAIAYPESGSGPTYGWNAITQTWA